jgi:dTDP-4-dehydrorhamnose 3,5-epimerase
VTFEQTPLQGAYLINAPRHEDERGYFTRTHCEREFAENGLHTHWVQGNASYNKRTHTLRGMHWQAEPHGEVKLVRCVVGAVYDVIIDLRSDSPSYRQHYGVELTPENGTQLYIPAGFAHGFLTLQDHSTVLYQMGAFFEPTAARGLRYNDPAFNIAWPAEVAIISDRDRDYPDYQD